MGKSNEEFAKENEEARETMRKMEEQDEVPSDLEEWPDDRAKTLTFGSEGDEAYGDGATGKLGPAGVVHHEDGSVSVGGEKVDDPENYKGEPIPDPREAMGTSPDQLKGDDADGEATGAEKDDDDRGGDAEAGDRDD